MLYQTNSSQLKGAPATLCYPVFDSFEASHFGGRKKLYSPSERYQLIRGFASKYLQSLTFGDVHLRVGTEPLNIDRKTFVVPDLEFGQKKVLSITGRSGAQQVRIEDLGKARAALMRDRHAGFFTQGTLGPQLFFMPQSIADTFGSKFLDDLRQAVNELNPVTPGYDPRLVVYNDRVGKTFVEQGREIIDAAKRADCRSSYALVMIHDTRKVHRQEDQLAALVTRKLNDFDICASVIHTTVVSESYRADTTPNGVRYSPRAEKRGRLSGYLRNVALNKVFLTNQFWPFVLAQEPHAELSIGIDVKGNTVGLTLVSGRGQNIRTVISTSHQKERLLTPQVRKLLGEAIAAEAKASLACFGSIALHRDGILFDSERRGFLAALSDLKEKGVIRNDVRYAMLEISKSAPAPIRLFDRTQFGNSSAVNNPQVGAYYVVDQSHAFLCSTGRAFPREGTTNPLHVHLVEGDLSFVDCLEDIYRFTCLAWTRPEDCTRYPITIKLTDRRLGSDAATFDEDAFEFEGLAESAGAQ